VKRWVGFTLLGLSFLILLTTQTASADDKADGKKAEESKNYCHSEENKQEFEDLLVKFPKDEGIIKLYAIREGLCAMIDSGKVPLDVGIDIWEAERSRLITERTNQELRENKKVTL
jgi:hypothetical protein